MLDAGMHTVLGGRNLTGSNPRALAATPLDVLETPTSYIVTMDAPGIRKEDLTIKFEDSGLLIAGARRVFPPEHEGSKMCVTERRGGQSAGAFALAVM